MNTIIINIIINGAARTTPLHYITVDPRRKLISRLTRFDFNAAGFLAANLIRKPSGGTDITIVDLTIWQLILVPVAIVE